MNLIDGISQSLEANKCRKGISYFNGITWSSITYEEINGQSKEIQKNLEEITDKEWTYILLYLKLTSSYPLLILGILKSSHGFICVGEEQVTLLNYYISELKIKYILSNVPPLWKGSLENSPILKLEFELLGETIQLWDTQNEALNFGHKYLYAIKTSGTTGTSKLIQVPHDCIYPNIKALSEILHIESNDVIPLLTPVTFDPSVIELFLALYNGCSMCILDKSVKDDPHMVADLLFSNSEVNVTLIQTTPSLFKRWNLSVLREKLFQRDSTLRAVILGGEEFPSIDEVSSWNLPSHISLYNIYGITEVSCWASINKVCPSKQLSNDIGNPLLETDLKIINPNNDGEGELVIGSCSRKCLLDNEICDEVFKDGHSVFRATGDIFKNVDGKLYFVGRKDELIKRWGARISLSFIEQTAQKHENTADCSCVLVKMTNHHRIGLFVVQKSESNLFDLRKFLKKRLPRFSWLDFCKILPSLPLTNHGKVCKETLKAMCIEPREVDIKTKFNELWDNYTIETVPSTHDFIALGGDSFTALQFYYEFKYILPSLPESFAGLLLRRKTREDIWKIIEDSYVGQNYNEDDESNFPTSVDFNLTSDASEYLLPEINIIKMYFKGKISTISPECLPYSETLDIDNGALEFKQVWNFNLGRCVDSSPLGVTLADKRNIVIIGSHSGQVVVIDANTHGLISECTLPDRIESSACISLCGNHYYIGCHDGRMYCISIKTGSQLWKFQTKDLVKSSAVAYKKYIFFGSYDKFMYCLYNKGIMKYRRLLRSPILSEVLIDDNIAYCMTLGSIAVIKAESGEVLREVDHPPIFSTPIINAGNLVIADVQGKVQWINKETGNVEHTFETNNVIFSSIAKVNSAEEIILFGCNDCCVYCLKNKELLWKTALDSTVISTPFVGYQENVPKFVVCFSSTGKAYLLNFSDGKIICNYSLPGEVFSSPILFQNKVIVGCRDDNVHFLEIKNC